MARTIEQVVKDQVGELFIQYASAVAQLEHALERIKALETEAADSGKKTEEK